MELEIEARASGRAKTVSIKGEGFTVSFKQLGEHQAIYTIGRAPSMEALELIVKQLADAMQEATK